MGREVGLAGTLAVFDLAPRELPEPAMMLAGGALARQHEGATTEYNSDDVHQNS